MEIFVFGSNLSGIHGAGSAYHAFKNHGAKWGKGVGFYGNSYAIPTKNHDIETMPLQQIKPYVDEFIKFAYDKPHTTFNIVAIGCGLAGYTPEQIAPMFKDAPINCNLPEEFKE
jgi:hypothetical protein